MVPNRRLQPARDLAGVVPGMLRKGPVVDDRSRSVHAAEEPATATEALSSGGAVMRPWPSAEQIARVCHEANRAWCEINGDESQVPWDEAPDWIRESATGGVHAVMLGLRHGFADVLSHDDAAAALHVLWMKDKIRDGWTYGESKDPIAKTHPCICPFHELPEEQQQKDRLFLSIVLCFSALSRDVTCSCGWSGLVSRHDWRCPACRIPWLHAEED